MFSSADISTVEFPFKLVIWDEKIPGEQGSEHVVYSPGEPIDPELELDYLAKSFTFPRTQMVVFYQNMVSILNASGEDDEDSAEGE